MYRTCYKLSFIRFMYFLERQGYRNNAKWTTQRERERNSMCLFIASDGSSCPHWPRPEPGTRSFFWVTQVNDRDLGHALLFFCLFVMFCFVLFFMPLSESCTRSETTGMKSNINMVRWHCKWWLHHYATTVIPRNY